MDYTIDAVNQKLGRLASRVALILQGKLSANYEPRLSGKDRVIIKNVTKMILSGKKNEQKVYYRHTGYMGHIKELTYKEAMIKSPEKVLRSAVRLMLPKNRLRDQRLKRLIIEK